MEDKKTILIIDDEEDLVNILKLRFEKKSYNVLTAYDGEAGLKIANESKPHLILLDINMPKMNGIEFYNKLCAGEKKPPYPVLVLSARGELKDLFKAIDADGFMSKPFELDELYKEAELIIEKRHGKQRKKELKSANAPRKILIVEDNQDVFNQIAVTFLNAGYVVTSSKNGVETIEKILVDVPDVLLIKLGLPDLPGDIVAAKLRQMPKTMDIAIVVYTKESDELSHAIGDKISSYIGIKKIVQSNDPYVLLKEADAVLREKIM